MASDGCLRHEKNPSILPFLEDTTLGDKFRRPNYSVLPCTDLQEIMCLPQRVDH